MAGFTNAEQGRLNHNPNSPDLPITRRGGVAPTSRLTAAVDFFRRKLDRIPTFTLRRAGAEGDGYRQEDIVTGERFYLMPHEITAELARRDALALEFAELLFNAYAVDADWRGINGDKLKPFREFPAEIRKHWMAAAEAATEKYRAML